MPYFDNLRTIPWNPSFTWVSNAAEAADQINSFHEDYPQRVPATLTLLEVPFLLPPPSHIPNAKEIHNRALLSINRFLFQPEFHAGRFRDVNVRVGNHRPPDWELVPKLMLELEQRYLGQIDSLQVLKDWYYDFETIHPFEDGNGRVGGIIVASFAHAKEPELGWLAPNQ